MAHRAPKGFKALQQHTQHTNPEALSSFGITHEESFM